jgi:hypothetical protein
LGAIGMVIPEFYTDLIGIGITAVVFIIQRRKLKTQTVLA